MLPHIKELDSKNFHSETSNGNWIIDFWAEWCNPCKEMSPEFDDASEHLKGRVHFAKVDIEKERALTKSFGILSIPCLVLIKDGKVVAQSPGYREKDEIVELAEQSF